MYDILEPIRRRPGLYLGKNELVRLYSYLAGCQFGLGQQGFTFRHAEPDFWKFHDWVAQRLGYYESTSGWYNMIRERSASEEEAFDKFYELLDEFRATAGTTIA